MSGHDIGAYADRLRDKDGFRIVGMEELEAEPSGRYDVISMIEVVEHLQFPNPVFKLAARLQGPAASCSSPPATSLAGSPGQGALVCV